jgi:SAM-dependent methyltransferase
VSRADLPAEQALTTIYDEGYFQDQPGSADRHGYADYLRDEPLHRANARRRLKLLARYRPSRGRLLDVGSAAGFFVDEARHAGWDAEGVDVSPAMVEWANSHLRLDLMRSTFTKAEFQPESFDVVTMWDYIEHTIDPQSEVRKASMLLRPCGILALSTGDIGSVSARVTGRHWHLLTPEHHNYFFDLTTLRRLLEQNGYRVLDERHRAGLYSIPHVLHKVAAVRPLRALRGPAQRLVESRVGSAGLPINLFDVVTVVARRG